LAAGSRLLRLAHQHVEIDRVGHREIAGAVRMRPVAGAAAADAASNGNATGAGTM
jgi:hypothetical protein